MLKGKTELLSKVTGIQAFCSSEMHMKLQNTVNMLLPRGGKLQKEAMTLTSPCTMLLIYWNRKGEKARQEGIHSKNLCNKGKMAATNPALQKVSIYVLKGYWPILHPSLMKISKYPPSSHHCHLFITTALVLSIVSFSTFPFWMDKNTHLYKIWWSTFTVLSIQICSPGSSLTHKTLELDV